MLSCISLGCTMYTIDGKFMEKGLTAWGFLNAIAKSSWECKPNVEVSARITRRAIALLHFCHTNLSWYQTKLWRKWQDDVELEAFLDHQGKILCCYLLQTSSLRFIETQNLTETSQSRTCVKSSWSRWLTTSCKGISTHGSLM